MLQEYIRILIPSFMFLLIILCLVIRIIKKEVYIYKFLIRSDEINELYKLFKQLMMAYKEKDGGFVSIDEKIEVKELKYIQLQSVHYNITFTTVEEGRLKLLFLIRKIIAYGWENIDFKNLLTNGISREIIQLEKNIKEIKESMQEIYKGF